MNWREIYTCLESYLELGARGSCVINSFGGLEGLEIIADGMDPVVFIYGKKLYVTVDSKMCSEEVYISVIRNFGYHNAHRKLSSHLVDQCLKFDIYPKYNYVETNRLKKWADIKVVPEYIWLMYTTNEQALLSSRGFFRQSYGDVLEPVIHSRWIFAIWRCVKLIGY
jgi:hypothetical protein